MFIHIIRKKSILRLAEHAVFKGIVDHGSVTIFKD